MSVESPRDPETLASAAEVEREGNEEAQETYDEGQAVHVGYTSYSVWRSWWSNKLSENEFLDQKPNARFLFVEITVKNNDTKARMVPPFSLLDDDDAEYEASSKGWAAEGSLGILESLNPSVSKQGFIVFDVPPNRNYRLKLSGGFWSLQDAFVLIDPGESKDAALSAQQYRKDRETAVQREKEAEEKRISDEKRRKAIEAAKWRTWTDKSGKFKSEAKYGGMASGMVKLTNKEGKSITVPFEKLSKQDQGWIKGKPWKKIGSD